MASHPAAEHHTKAAEHHKEAAKHHEQAAEHYKKGDHAKAAEQAHHATGHHFQATHHAEEAAKTHATRTRRPRSNCTPVAPVRETLPDGGASRPGSSAEHPTGSAVSTSMSPRARQR